jgi:chromosome segregation ATPase
MRITNLNSICVALLLIGLSFAGSLVNEDIAWVHPESPSSGHRQVKIVETTIKSIEQESHKHSDSPHSHKHTTSSSEPKIEPKHNHGVTDPIKILNQMVEKAGNTAVNSKFKHNKEKAKPKSRWGQDFSADKSRKHNHQNDLKICLKEKETFQTEISHLKRQNNFHDNEIKKLTHTTSNQAKELRTVQNNLREAQLEIQNLKAQLQREQTNSKARIDALEQQLSACKGNSPRDMAKLKEKVFDLEIDIKQCRSKMSKLEIDCAPARPVHHHSVHVNNHRHSHVAPDSHSEKHRTKVLLGSSVVSDLY